jgi:ribosomal protein L35
MKHSKKAKKRIEVAVYGVIHCSCGDSHLIRHGGKSRKRKQDRPIAARRD